MSEKTLAEEIADELEKRLGVHRKPKPDYQDPKCPKCGLILGNRMMYCCGEAHCPVGLN